MIFGDLNAQAIAIYFGTICVAVLMAAVAGSVLMVAIGLYKFLRKYLTD